MEIVLALLHTYYSAFPPSSQVKRDVGDVTILVNNAGIVTGKKFLELPDDKIDLTFRVNTTAHFWVSVDRGTRSRKTWNRNEQNGTEWSEQNKGSWL